MGGPSGVGSTLAVAGTWVGAATLCSAGVAKALRPRHTANTLSSLAGRPLRLGLHRIEPLLARTLGVAEVALGLTVLSVGGRVPALALCVLFTLFGLTIERLLAVAPSRPCGCFGGGDRPPTHLHTALTGGVAVAAAGAALGGSPALLDLHDQPVALVVSLLGVAAAAAAWWAVENLRPPSLRSPLTTDGTP